MGGELAMASCACAAPPAGGLHGFVDPSSEVLIELDAHGAATGGFPHMSSLLNGSLCRSGPLTELLSADAAQLIVDRAGVVRTSGQPTSFSLPAHQLRVRIAPYGEGTAVLLRREHVHPTIAAASATFSDQSFWQLFEAAPLPLVIETAASLTGEGATRLNRCFTEVFGYTADDVPTVQHWWPLAYPDETYRAAIREEWFRRVSQAVSTQTTIAPMAATVMCKDGSTRDVEFFAAAIGDRYVVVFVDLTESKRAAQQLEDARAQVAALRELLPVCAWCKKVRNDQGYWQQLEEFVAKNPAAGVTHGICPECCSRRFPALGRPRET